MLKRLKEKWNEPYSPLATWSLLVFTVVMCAVSLASTTNVHGLLGTLIGILWGMILLMNLMTFLNRRRMHRSVTVVTEIVGPDGSVNRFTDSVDPKTLSKDDPRREIIAGMRRTGSRRARTTGQIDAETGEMTIHDWEFDQPGDQPY